MTNPHLTRIVFLLDRSGSMTTIKSDVEGGFAAFIAEQKKNPGECQVTLAQFDNEYETVYTSTPLADVPPLALRPRGGTALRDAMGRIITDTGTELAALPEDQRPGTVIVVIMTDGMENASHEWTQDAVKKLVEQQRDQYQWQFVYLGADQNAVEVGKGLGIHADHAMTYTRGNSGAAMSMAAANISNYISERSIDRNAALIGYSSEQREAAITE